MDTESHQVSLMGREFRIKSSDDAEHIQSAADYVNETISSLKGAKRHVPLQHLLLLASLSMADELIKERKRLDSVREKIRAQSRALLSRLDT
jgi:cell division protein ZapA (FtsZ GTPase activity inhibitor)